MLQNLWSYTKDPPSTTINNIPSLKISAPLVYAKDGCGGGQWGDLCNLNLCLPGYQKSTLL